jgi:hypothetical protein
MLLLQGPMVYQTCLGQTCPQLGQMYEKKEEDMVLQMEKINEFREEMKHLEREYAVLYLKNLQHIYWENLEKEKMAAKLDAFKRENGLN